MLKRNRVVITGMGILAPNGIGNDEFWGSLLAGRSGIGPITLFDARDLKSRIAGEVKNFDPHAYIEPELKPRRMARHTQFAYAATMMALEDAGLEISNADFPSPTPVVVGVSIRSAVFFPSPLIFEIAAISELTTAVLKFVTLIPLRTANASFGPIPLTLFTSNRNKSRSGTVMNP